MTALAPQDLAFADDAPWTFDFVGTIDASRAEVWGAFIDNQSWTVWCTKCRECRATSATFDGVGATRHIRVSGLTVDERFIGWEPERLWAFTVVDMRMSFAAAMVERATFETSTDGRTVITYRMAIRPRRWAVPLRGVIRNRAAASFAQSFARLDAYLAAKRQSAPPASVEPLEQ